MPPARGRPALRRAAVRVLPGAGDDRGDAAHCRTIWMAAGARDQQPLVNFLKAQVLILEKRDKEALSRLERVVGRRICHGRILFLQTARFVYAPAPLGTTRSRSTRKRWPSIPTMRHAHIGLCRIALRRRRFSVAAHWALEALREDVSLSAGSFPAGARAGGNEGIRAGGRGVSRGHFLQPEFSRSACSARCVNREISWATPIPRASIGDWRGG